MAYKWTGEKFVSRKIDDRTRVYLCNLPFKHTPPARNLNPANNKIVKKLQEMMTDDEWNDCMQQFLLRRLQYEKVATNLVRSWASAHFDMFYDVMQEYTAQKRWHNLDLAPFVQELVDASKERGSPNTSVLIEKVLDHMGRYRCTVSKPRS